MVYFHEAYYPNLKLYEQLVSCKVNFTSSRCNHWLSLHKLIENKRKRKMLFSTLFPVLYQLLHSPSLSPSIVRDMRCFISFLTLPLLYIFFFNGSCIFLYSCEWNCYLMKPAVYLTLNLMFNSFAEAPVFC